MITAATLVTHRNKLRRALIRAWAAIYISSLKFDLWYSELMVRQMTADLPLEVEKKADIRRALEQARNDLA